MNEIKKKIRGKMGSLLMNYVGTVIPDEPYLRLMWLLKMHKRLNLKNPKTFNEKLQWLKLHDRKPVYTTMVDKAEAKKYVADQIGEEYIIPTLGVWEKFDDIDFPSLPDQFVLKCTHDSGGVVICKDKESFNKSEARKVLESGLRKNFYLKMREWPYKNVKPQIIAEEYLKEASENNLVEYKIFCFNGTAKMVLVCKGAAHGNLRTNDYCDLELNRLPFTSLYPNSEGKLDKPKHYEKMIELAERLSSEVPLLRVDFYSADDKIFFGELTFYHNSGFCTFNPDEWDLKLGQMLDLESK